MLYIDIVQRSSSMSGYTLTPQQLIDRYGLRPDGHPVYRRSIYDQLVELAGKNGNTFAPSYWEWVSAMTKYTFLDPSKGVF